jgi:catechol 2,3-dioxygenase-like lactoylglutathione lyase family enzyme
MSGAFGSAAPIFRVSSVRASISYYADKLGFRHDWGETGLASVSRGDCTIFLCEWDQGKRGTWAWIGVADVGVLHEELMARGAAIRFPPTNYEWAFEMQVEDLDGNVLRLGSEPKKGMPYGAFLDAAGVLWEETEDGGYRALDDDGGEAKAREVQR